MRSCRTVKILNQLSKAPSMVIEYKDEYKEDAKISEIQKFCFGYFSDNGYESEYSLDEIYKMQEFVFEKYWEVSNIKNRVCPGDHNGQIQSISYKLDMATLGGSLEAPTKESYRSSLVKETDLLMNTLGLQSVLLDRILEESVKTVLSEKQDA